ncbi:hypothetical protein Angca_008723, partial [Angiostrongylus cantonensis]
VSYDDEGLNALLFTAQGDMRQVCDEPHPQLMANMLTLCAEQNFRDAAAIIHDFYRF